MEEVWQAKLEMAWLALRQDDDQRAADLASEVLSEDPENPEALFVIGSSSLFLGDHQVAEAAVRSLLELEPEEAPSHFLLGLFHQQAKQDSKAAETAFRTAIRHDPDYNVTHAVLARLLGDQGRVEEGITIAHKALKEDPENLPLINALQTLHRLNKDPELAQRFGEMALRLDPEHAAPHLEMGMRLLERGAKEQAHGSFLESLRLRPADGGTQRAIAFEQVRTHPIFRNGYFLPFKLGFIGAVAITPVFWWLLSLAFSPLIYVAWIALVLGLGAYLYHGLFYLCFWLALRRIRRGRL